MKEEITYKYKKIEERCKRIFSYKFVIKDKDVIYDAITSIFLQYYKSKDSVQNFDKWLNGAIFNHYYLYLNRKKRNRVFYFDEFITSPVYNDYPGLKLELDEIIQAIKKLSSPYKEIITLRLIDDLSYKEIALKLDMNEGTVRNYYSRSITKIANLFPLITILIRDINV